MKKLASLGILLSSLFLINSCVTTPQNIAVNKKYENYFKDSSAIFVLYTPAENSLIVSNKLKAQTRYTPCSTFKIVSTLLGLETGVLKDINTKMGYDGTKYAFKGWNKNVNLKEAFQYSCVWYYKKMIAKLNKNYVEKSLKELPYGNCDISVWNNNGHNVFWIESTLQISPLEQVQLLHKIFNGKTNFSQRNIEIVKQCMQFPDINGVKIYGKTGTGRNYNTNHLEGWFVGFFEKTNGKRTYFAARASNPKKDIPSSIVKKNVQNFIKLNAK